MRIAALVTCYNRCVLTLTCLERLHQQDLPAGVTLEIVLVDDGSRDGTADAVGKAFPEVHIIRGSGSLYWCGGMRLAWRAAAASDPDFYLLFNDDTALDRDALQALLELAGTPEERVIAVASIADESTGEANYGAVSLTTGILQPTDADRCDTFTANCALVPRAVYQELGILHEAYTHAMGDTDYGIQARKRGIEIRKSSRFLGTCGSNAVQGTWRDPTLPRLKRFRLLQQPKGLPFREWLIFTRRNFGYKWTYYAISPFIRILAGR